MKFRLSFSFVVILFFVFLGFLEGGVLGSVGGFIAWAVSSLVLCFSLVPFFGFFLWQSVSDLFLNNLSRFIPLGSVREKVFWIFGVQAAVYCVLTSVLTVVLAVLAWKYWRRRKRVRSSVLHVLSQEVKGLGVDFPSKLKQILERFKRWEGTVDKKLLGTVFFWLGSGVASHDFWWESQEVEVDVERPTHGVYVGLGLATLGINMMGKPKPSYYIGLASAYFAFVLLKILPRGISRVIAHVFWWFGTGLMVYNWYILADQLLKKRRKQARF